MAFSRIQKYSSRHAALMVAAAFVGVLGCASRDRAPGAVASPPVATSALQPSSAAPLDAGAKSSPITSPCVLHAGQGKRQTRTVRLPGAPATTETPRGACSANAECIATKGHETPGDGFVRLDCTDLACTCSLDLLSSARPKPNTSSFELSSPCTTSGQALQLIVERCMPGMVVVRH